MVSIIWTKEIYLRIRQNFLSGDVLLPLFSNDISLTGFAEYEKHPNQRLNKIAENEWLWWRTLCLFYHRRKEANFSIRIRFRSGALTLLICFRVSTTMRSSCLTIGSCLNWEFYRLIFDRHDLHNISLRNTLLFEYSAYLSLCFCNWQFHVDTPVLFCHHRRLQGIWF